jgi:ABC-type lipoprotein export system ATPase subunit
LQNTSKDGPFIVCDNLIKIYKVGGAEVMALQGLELSAEKGEFMGIVGASGSGKTTLMNVLGGLDRPTAGRAIVNRQDLLRLSDSALNRYRREQVGFVWQQTSRNLIPYLTALENVELPMTVAGKNWGEKRSWAGELLEAVGLSARRHHKLAEMSGGEQQRVAIAVALANKPILLLADEPTGEVDSATARMILETFRRLNRAYGLTTLIVTHDQQVAGHVDRVVAIRDGKTSTETIRQVVRAPQAADGHEDAKEGGQEDRHEVRYHEYIVLDSVGRLQLPPEYRERFNIGDRVKIELQSGGILLKPVEGRGLVKKEAPSEEEDKTHPPTKQRRPLLGRLRNILPARDKKR